MSTAPVQKIQAPVTPVLVDSVPQSPRKAKSSTSSEEIFKVICLVLSIVLSLCIGRIFEFRVDCQQKGLYVFASSSLWLCVVTFFGIWIVKYSYFHFCAAKVESMVNPKYEGQAREIKARSVLKLTFDVCFYTTTTVMAYSFFRNEPWFPSLIGGAGQCDNIYLNYPDWPVEKRTELELFTMIQLGVHLFSLFEILTLKRKTERKFYEFLLHHFVAASLILCSMVCNQITAGTMVLIVHDFSDIFLAFSRAYVETRLPQKMYVFVPMVIGLMGSWIYMRLIVFPCCLLSNVYMNRPTPGSSVWIIYYPYMYLLVMASVLLCMHLYWTYYILKSFLRSIKTKDTTNEHDKLTKET